MKKFKPNISLVQDLIIDLEMDYQRMSRSGQEIYCLLCEAMNLDPVESNVRPYVKFGECYFKEDMGD